MPHWASKEERIHKPFHFLVSVFGLVPPQPLNTLRKEKTYETTPSSTPLRHHHPSILRIFEDTQLSCLALLSTSGLTSLYRPTNRGAPRFRCRRQPDEA